MSSPMPAHHPAAGVVIRRLYLAMGTLAVALCLGIFLSAPASADVNVFVRFGDGMIVSCPRGVAIGYCNGGNAVMLSNIPDGYVTGPSYAYYQGYESYYPRHYRYHNADYYRSHRDYGGYRNYHRQDYRSQERNNHYSHGNGNRDRDRDRGYDHR